MPKFRPAAAPDAQPSPAGGIPAVLVVDDDRGVRAVIRRTLRGQGYEVLEAADAEAALVMLGQHAARVRAVLTDDRMPGMSGWELASVVARVYPAVRVVLMSGAASEDDRDPSGPPVRLLPKPFSPSGLLDTLSAALQEPGPA
jgi:CheY-like chemotaxis protein